MNNGYITATIHPFVVQQEICVYVGNECVQITSADIDHVCEQICTLCKKYNIDEVYFHGGQLYALKWKDDFTSHKFTKQDIHIHID